MITEAFELASPGGQTGESKFYNMFLHYLVVPQWKRPEQKTVIDFTTIFIISHREHLVLFVEIKPSDHIHYNSSRASADKHI